MMRKKHRIMVISALLLLAVATGIGVYYGIRTNTQLLWRELYISKWNDPAARYLICRAGVKGEPNVNFSDCNLSFRSNSTKTDIINTNKGDYIGEITYYNTGIVNQASLFYTDNNYYVLYYDENFHVYTVKNCYMLYNMNYLMCRIPCPVPLGIEYSVFEVSQEFGENELDYLYDNYTFDEAVEFYGRISEEYVSIDTDRQQITLDGFEVFKSEIIEECLTLDFKERTVIVLGADGSRTVLDGTERMEE